ncbi:LysM peptidoglycan-binding domain-containing protein [Arthrobacter sp. ISL-48]|uniref:LysM peptidoglycan-binding domain-containing protein n=1 Tax=Arthrobacter sp. ISL-48 TaxID=2819110 RepID=UPI001BE6C51B|nr:LysM domain-containing protein [Arthrobacter sp. ISL-48]MBT2531868.1 LysM peptidoglycan-binding domain-containing protein [Arthrobacter sp. ISL-48]
MVEGKNRGVGADAAMAAVLLLLGSFLLVTGSGLVDQWRLSADRRQSPDVDDLLGAFANAGGLAIVGWWVLSMLLATLAAVLEGRGSRTAAAAAGRLCPAFMRRLALAALSVQLLSAPLANAAEPLPAGPAWLPTQEVAVSADWAPTDVTDGTGEPCPVSEIQPDWRPNAPVTDPGLLAAQPVRTAQLPLQNHGEFTVLAGDTLWDIAARELGPTATDVDVALQWPRWYEANQAVIGENPDVLLPGQILKPPSAA